MGDIRSPVRTSDGSTSMDRRIRHITAIQIRNLTPFPARDSLASALTQPAERSQFTHGHLSDDLDVAMQRKRSRRISVNSITTLRSTRSDDGTKDQGSPGGTAGERGRKTSGPRVSIPSDKGYNRRLSTSGSAPTIRPHRARTNSLASSIGSHISSPPLSSSAYIGGSNSAATSSFMLPDNSQTGLEKVIQSRLVETFIALTIPRLSMPPTPPPITPHISPLISPTFSKSQEGSLSRKVVKPSPLSPSEKSTAFKARRDSAASPRPPTTSPSSHVKSTSTSVVRTSGEVKRAPRPSTLVPLSRNPSSEPQTSTPNYFSSIHRPSTQPRFPIDARSNDFTKDIDSSGHKMKVEVWGRVVGSTGREHPVRKGKEKEVDGGNSGLEWKMLDERDVNLRDLVPLSQSSFSDKSQLPSNSLLITLSPPGEVFYLPPTPSSRHRSPSPSGGYASDPETDVRRVEPSGLSPTSAGRAGHHEVVATTLSRRRHRGGIGTTTSPEEPVKTAGWQDLFKLVTLQSCILDNEHSLSDVVRGIDKTLEADPTFVQRREISEREACLEELSANHQQVIEEANDLREQIQIRRESLRQRKEILELAKKRLLEEVDSEYEMAETIVQDRALYSTLRSRFGPTRTTLLTMLSSIYPIELLSPPDLLYTILDVPLPIPLSSSDPAPPLTLPSHKDVNEDAVATSLGYAAQVVQLLSAYLGKALVYPVTCIGSRSLIRDNISAMVGPRMFPLYSKGVDTYRFEYGVFLLNKDIELLMADRDLRALDMRHTLPNLKNLLLTLTDGEGANLRQRPPDSPMSLASDLGSTLQEDSPIDPNPTTPKVSDTASSECNSPPASGSTTPTAAATEAAAKKGRPFLAFSPLTDFLRGRYPSASRISVKGSPDTSEDIEASEERHSTSSGQTSEPTSEQQSGSEHDDHKISDVLCAMEGRKLYPAPIVNGGEKKVDEENHSPAHATPPFPLTPSGNLWTLEH